MIRRQTFAIACFFLTTAAAQADSKSSTTEALPKPGTVLVNKDRAELILCAVVQHPRGKPCIDEYGERIQAFVGCSRAAGGDAKMAAYFVFLVDVPTEEVYMGLVSLGAKTRVHYSMQQGKKLSGLTPATKADDYLQGDPVVLSVFWKDGSRWVERPYQDFVSERVLVDGNPVEKPWTLSFVIHGGGAIHKSGTGCIACPCDCPGGIIADNRYPIYDPKPLVMFHMNRAPAAGTQVYIRIRAVTSR
jgi:hypothetical protein